MRHTALTSLSILALAGSQAAGAETLFEALAAAYNSNPTLEAQRAQLRALDENISVAISNFRPTVQGTANFNYTDSNSTTTNSLSGAVVNDVDINGEGRSFNARITQPIFRGLANFSDKAQAEAQINAGRAQLLQTEQQVLLDGVTAYVNVVRDNAVLELNNNQVQVLRRQLEASQDRFRVGEITRTDVAQSEARLEGAISGRITAEATLDNSRATYERVIGNFPTTLEQEPPLPVVPENLDGARNVALTRNPAVRIARSNERAAHQAVRSARGGILPSVNGFADYNRSNNPTLTFDPSIIGFAPARSFRQAFQGGFQLTVPLYQGGREYSDVRRAKQTRSQRMLEIAESERQVQETVRIAWQNLRAARASIESSSSQVRANDIALEGVRQEAAVGSRTTLDVLDAEQELLDSRVNLVRAKRDRHVAAFSLLSAMGQLNAADLNLPVEYYDPETNYRQVKWKFFGVGASDGR